MSSSADSNPKKNNPFLSNSNDVGLPGVQRDLVTRDLQDVSTQDPIPTDFLRSDPEAHVPVAEGRCARDWTRAIEPDFTADRPARIGMELEIFLFDRKSGLPLGMHGSSQDHSGQRILRELARRYEASGQGSARLIFEEEQEGYPETVYGLLLSEGIGYSLEPGGQFEVATPPVSNLAQLRDQLRRALELVEDITGEDVLFASLGTNPLTKGDFSLQIPKKRYRILTRYFESQSDGRGIDMMRHACTVQPNIDVGPDVAAWAHAVQLAYELTEPFKILFPNSYWFQNRHIPDGLERQRIWHAIDSTRTGEPNGIRNAIDLSCLYASWAADAFVFWVEDLPENEQPVFGELTFSRWRKHGYKGTFPSLADWERHLATLFPEVRLRGFLELRMFDAQPFDQLMPLMSLVRGLLQSPRGRENLRQTMPSLKVALSSMDSEGFRHHVFKVLRDIAAIGLGDLSQPDSVEGMSMLNDLRLTHPTDFDAQSPAAYLAKVATTKPSRII